MHKLDAKDRTLLTLLQHDADTPLVDLAHAVSLSTTPCWRRIQRLKERGFITGNRAVVSRSHVNLPVTVFVSIRAGRHDTEWLERWCDTVGSIPEVLDCYRMSGDVDYMLRVVVPDIASYDRVYRTLIESVPMSDVCARFALGTLKESAVLPLDYAA